MCAARRAFVGARYDAERNVGAAYSAGAAFLGAFRLPAEGCRGFFAEAGRALSAQPYCTVPVCFKRGFQQAKGFRPGDESVQALYGLSLNLGRFDLESQLAAIERTKASVTAALLALQGQKRARCRSYETIGICAGLALAVMLL